MQQLFTITETSFNLGTSTVYTRDYTRCTIYTRGFTMIHTHYNKMLNMEESVDVFAPLNTRKWEHKSLL